MHETLEPLSEYLLNQSWQILFVFCIVGFACFLLRKASSHWRYWLWLVVLAKCLVPPMVNLSLAVLPKSQQAVDVPAVTTNITNTSFLVSLLPTQQAEQLAIDTESPHSLVTIAKENLLKAPEILSEPVKQTEQHIKTSLSNRITIGWLVGTCLFFLYALIKVFHINLKLSKARRPAGQKLQHELANLCTQMGMNHRPELWLIDCFSQPFVMGLFRGAIYLPSDFAETPLPQRNQFLAHELAHVWRFDAAINTLQIIIQGFFFYHPFVWLANKQIRREREKCCDEIAISSLNSHPKIYGSAIVNAIVKEQQAKRSISSLAVAGPVKNVEERIKTIMSPNKVFYTRPKLKVILTVLLLAIVALPTALTLTVKASQNTKDSKSFNFSKRA